MAAEAVTWTSQIAVCSNSLVTKSFFQQFFQIWTSKPTSGHSGPKIADRCTSLVTKSLVVFFSILFADFDLQTYLWSLGTKSVQIVITV